MSLQTVPEKAGYRATGWYLDPDLTSLFDFGAKISSDLTLYAGYTLTNPEFSLSGRTFVYSGVDFLVDFTTLSHPLDNDGIYSFVWENESGEVVARTRSFTVKKVSDSGKYRCHISFSVNGNTTSVTTPYIYVKVEPQKIKVPTIPQVEYTGYVQYPIITSSAFYRVTEIGAIECGEYPVTITLIDSENYVFENCNSDECKVLFTITKAKNEWSQNLEVADVYEGYPINPQAKSRFGEVLFEYSNQKEGEYSKDIPLLVGNYYVRAIVFESENYFGITSEPVGFSILPEVVIGLAINTPPDKTEYIAFDFLNREGLSFVVTYNSGRVVVVDGKAVALSYVDGDSLRYGDRFAVAEYLGKKTTIPVTVSKARYNISVSFSDTEIEYNGRYNSISPIVNITSPLDGIPLQYKVEGGGTACGIYEITLTFFSSSNNYVMPEPMSAKLKITPKMVTVNWEMIDFVYDGEIKSPNATFFDVFGAKITLDVSGGVIFAGEGYLATAQNTDNNYIFDNQTVRFDVKKATYDLSGVFWSEESFVYDGKEKSVFIHGLPSGVNVIGYIDNFGTDAGEYTARVSLEYDTRNYYEPEIAPFIWRIEKAEYDTSCFFFTAMEYEYDGYEKYPQLSGEMPIGKDGITLTFSFLSGVKDATEVFVPVTVVFKTQSKNYNTPMPIAVGVKINPKGIYVVWENLNFTYTGEEFIPLARAEACEVVVLGAMTDAGEHIATAVSLNGNYCVINDKCSFVISKAQNIWLSEPSIDGYYTSGSANPKALSKYGTVEFCYTDSDGNVISMPTACGEYFLICYVPEGNNYLSLSSSPVPFAVFEVMPVELLISFKRNNFLAFEIITGEDIECQTRFNDGSFRNIPFENLKISYLNGKHLCFGDSFITVSYFNCSVQVPIMVNKASLDLSGAYWSCSEAVYNGENLAPQLLGLPDGVTVKEYTVTEAINAGVYYCEAIFIYDEKNYEAPSLPTFTFTVKKAEIKPPKKLTVTYNGSMQSPVLNDGRLELLEMAEYKDAGIYTVKICPKDENNYFISREDTLLFVIEPIILCVNVNDLKEYWFSEREEASYIMTDGNIITGDEVGIYLLVEKDRILAKCQNSNYILFVDEGDVITVNGFSPKTKKALGLSFLLSLTLLVGVSAIVLKKDTLKFCLASYKMRSDYVKAIKLEKEDAAKKESLIAEMSAEVLSVDVERADSLITNSMAKNLIKKSEAQIYTDGKKRVIINIDTLSDNFSCGDRVDINSLKAKGLIISDASYVKVLARGRIDKPLKVYLNDYSLAAIKMIVLTGGEAYRVQTSKKRG